MTTKEIILLVILVVALVVLLVVFFTIRNIEKYRNEQLSKLVPLNEEYYKNLQVVNKKYLPYFEENSSYVDFNFKSKGDKDELTQLELKKHYRFFKNKIFYLINDKLSNKLDIEEIDSKKYIVLNEKIESLQILVSFGNKDNLLVKYKVLKNEDSFTLEIDNSEVKIDEA